ncbi:unnamed protein product [Blepharisma stoltei]|uniref:Calcium-dependent protein kinase 1 n=1 Tax=Blepharisma stoltei TaxID=1481888 RepID=A0AAU9IFL9_9CILI|nr:unnamed protein product [Blepharisma stoltei]
MGCINSTPQNATEFKPTDNPDVSAEVSITSPSKNLPRDSILINRKQFIFSRLGQITDYYIIHDEIGSGAFSTVKRATHKETNLPRAIKIISKSGIADEVREKLNEEVEILKELDHPNIIKIYEIIEDDSSLNIVTELCEGQELFNKIVECKPFSETQAAIIMYQILSGLIMAHQRGIVHRDLKPENLLFLNNSKDSPLKIIDFGLSQKIKAENKSVNFVGTAYYIAPEVLESNYNTKCDLWSCGVILYLMLCGHPPFNGTSEEQIFKKISRGVFPFKGNEWAVVSREAKNLIKKMLTKDISKRCSAEEAFQDPWVQERVQGLVADRLIDENVLLNLVQFRTRNKLQQATMAFIASHFVSNQEIEGLRKMFVTLDANGDGKLNLDELRRGFAKYPNLSKMNIQEILENCDVDNNGFIDYNEFLAATLNWQKTLSHERLEAAFKAFDSDQSGSITVKEIKSFLGDESELEEGIWEQILKEADTNGDGVLDLEEFKNVMLKKID